MLNALEFLHERVNLDEFFKRATGAREPGIEAIVIGEISEYGMIMSLKELVDNARVKCAS